MSYLALARKWRPSQFNQVVGQSHVLTALENALTHNRLHHAYLFSGTRGVGKTTIGRLFAKGLNCETGITATPCGICDTCKEIDQGRFVDLLEIDAASRTKVEDTRELLDNVQYKPARGRFKVYLIDEVHMLSRHSFNALLKTLEEPPEYVKFLLATTDPQKLPVTILSRCLQFHLKPISVDHIHQQLSHILDQEKVSSESKALGMIAHAADGSMRDALSLSDQAIALGNGHVMTDSVSAMLGTLDTDQALSLLKAISSRQPQVVIESLSGMAENGVDWDGLLQQLAAQLHRLALYQALPATLDHTQPDAEKIALLSRDLSPQDVQLYYQIVLKGRDDLRLAPSEKIGLEMVALRMMAFRPYSAPQANHIDSMMTAATATDEQRTRLAPDNTPPISVKVPRDPLPSSNESRLDGKEETSLAPTGEPPRAPAPVPPIGESSVPSVSGLRHQLRSQRQGQPRVNRPKKTEATSVIESDSVLERVAQRHTGKVQVSPLSNEQPMVSAELEKNEPYQWRPIRPQVQKVNNELTPTQIKKALDHEKTAEMVQKLADESIVQNEWAKLISQLETAKMTEQLALNAHFEQQGSSIILTLRSQQAHLNNDRAQSELLEALNRVLGEPCQLSVTIGDQGETPLELREKLYQGKLKQAFISLEQDSYIQFITKQFAAQIDKDSVRPV
ncbi:DNA polymerase III subunit gamma/tau [Vibrio ostreicida]|uniref:DNA polymerase III subunit gamma/tau n=1 Tax=Vibrio ostreicida TaxID=526588 RepID=A0ABT8BTU8_9VIBR|nr:DNA polymerase III subunit gamma/tau [Vibrio ostreicida]MDN3610592.1 DNA polymerase III subunit gamma/tau [Vibrio ostreicida]NPD07410.1 DNA polymerase III subunit gamma/tau [Vibrio ostreicida]